MARINIDGAQNVEVSIKIPCEKNTFGTVGNHGSLYKSPPGIKR